VIGITHGEPRRGSPCQAFAGGGCQIEGGRKAKGGRQDKESFSSWAGGLHLATRKGRLSIPHSVRRKREETGRGREEWERDTGSIRDSEEGDRDRPMMAERRLLVLLLMCLLPVLEGMSAPPGASPSRTPSPGGLMQDLPDTPPCPGVIPEPDRFHESFPHIVPGTHYPPRLLGDPCNADSHTSLAGGVWILTCQIIARRPTQGCAPHDPPRP
jgi:hypothetical protein